MNFAILDSMITWRRVAGRIALCLLAAAPAASCNRGGSCGLNMNDRITVSTSNAGPAPCCGGSTFKDVPLSVNGDTEFQLASTAMPIHPGLVDAFLVPPVQQALRRSLSGAAPLCQIYLGPVAPGKVTSLAKLKAGTYRLWIQGYSSNETDGFYLIDIEIWNHSCHGPLM